MMSAKKRIATYAVAATAALSGGVGGLLVAFGPGAAAQTAEPSTTTTEPPAPSHEGPRHDGVVRPDDVAVAAEAIGITTEELRTQLQADKSISAVAKEKGVDLQKVIDAIIAADTKAIDEAVAAGRLTQAQADTKKSGLAAHVLEEVDHVGLGCPGPGGPGHGPGHGPGGPGGPVHGPRPAGAPGA
ncbi:MAG: hypothetical protein ACR2G7_11170 [Acidimicrobiales bacterium]